LVAGEQDVQVALASVNEYVRRMATLPGQRTLILVSPGFLTLTSQALTAESQIMDAAANANVTISALDARGLYVSEIDASEPGGPSEFSTRLKSEHRRNSMSLNENVMDELAAATGGTYFHNSNDLEGGFRLPHGCAGVSIPARIFRRRCEVEWQLPSPESENEREIR
jgi:VWFA-related protein